MQSNLKVCLISTYSPIACGIATYSQSLVNTFENLYLSSKVRVINVVNESQKSIKKDSHVVGFIMKEEPSSYFKAADQVNESDIDVVMLQHEYGLFGGRDGEHIIDFLERVNKPVVTTLHSVLGVKDHSNFRFSLTKRIIDLSDKIVVMTKKSKDILIKDFKIDARRVTVILHGVPNVRFDEKEGEKGIIETNKKTIFSTFGLINRGKGIEVAISALSEIARERQDFMYYIIGTTHPNILQTEGEAYREELEALVKEKGLVDNVIFINSFVGYPDLVRYLKATDIYLAPQRGLMQAVSGTISYAMGCGCAIISSPIQYSLEMLSNNRGIIVDCDHAKFAQEIWKVIRDEKILKKYQSNAYRYARGMIWPNIALHYLGVLGRQVKKNGRWQRRITLGFPDDSLKYLQKLTTKFGVIQHSKLSQKNYSFGYSLDDQARALIVAAGLLGDKGIGIKKRQKLDQLLTVYLSFLEKAVDGRGIIHNFFDRDFNFLDEKASDDSVARSFWALSFFKSLNIETTILKERIGKAVKIYEKNLSSAGHIKPLAYSLLGYCYLEDHANVKKTADILVTKFKESNRKSAGSWNWFEPKLTYANAIVVYALLKSYSLTKDLLFLRIAKKALKFLEKHYYYYDIPKPVSNAWLSEYSLESQFDQQPIEAADMIIMYNELYRIFGKKPYLDKAIRWKSWYYGNNISGVGLIDNFDGGVYDGISRNGVNKNKGAESIVTFLMACLSFEK